MANINFDEAISADLLASLVYLRKCVRSEAEAHAEKSRFTKERLAFELAFYVLFADKQLDEIIEEEGVGDE